MTAKHVEQIAALERLCFSDPWSARSIEAELENPLSCWLVAEENEQVLGYIGSQSCPPESDLMNVAVTPASRKRGIGRQLLCTLMTRLRSSGMESLTLEVRVSNTAARALYAQLGFSQVGKRPNYYIHPTEDALILRKELIDADSGY